MKTRALAISVPALLSLAACATMNVPPPPRQGLIPAGDGGAAGYQHGIDGSRFVVGQNTRRLVQYGYLLMLAEYGDTSPRGRKRHCILRASVKLTGDEGTVAISRGNGSTFGVPHARASTLRMPPFGASPQEHDAFVRDYFVKLGLPADQVDEVRCMTLLEANGRSDETAQAIPRVTAYYSIVKRVVEGIAAPDSFAWARANSEGRIVQEGVYWPVLPRGVLDEARRFKDILSDDQRRRAFQSRIPGDISKATLAIRHASATEGHFEVFASLDVMTRSSPAAPRSDARQRATDSSVGGMTVIRHFDINGTERFLPQEKLNLKDRYPERKDAER